jgi:signal transduction histidine kinase
MPAAAFLPTKSRWSPASSFAGRHVAAGGSGLGLAIVKRIVRDHGGQLAIRSAVNVGTTVTVSLPAYVDAEETDSRR